MNLLTAILIDDETDIRELLAISLTRMGYECFQAESYTEGLRLIESVGCNLCITDVRMPDGSGIDLVRQFKKSHPTTPIAVMTAYDTTEVAIEAMKAGAFDFLPKPIRAKRLENLVRDAQSLSARLAGTAPKHPKEPAQRLIGTSPAITALRESIGMAALSSAPILIVGEPGTGKTLIANCIHDQRQLEQAPFIHIDCAQIQSDNEDNLFPKSTQEAPDDSPFTRAQGGTLFLENVHELPPSLQERLTTLLKENAFTPTKKEGSSTADPRLLCSTTHHIAELIDAGDFHVELHAFLSVICLNVPSLEDRHEDIPALASHIVKTLSRDSNAQISELAIATLKAFEYQNNIRELKHILVNALRRSGGLYIEEIREEDRLTDRSRSGSTSLEGVDPLTITDLEAHLNEIENHIIRAVLDDVKWNRTKAAKRLGLTSRQFRYKLAKYELTPEE